MRVVFKALGLSVLLASCLFETRDPESAGPGYVSLQLELKANASALLKLAAGDTVFRLDTLVIVLSANGADTSINKYPISGRADSAAITVSQKIIALASLRDWKAVIYTIDTTLSPVAKDTVHRDSVTFSIKPGDTAVVSKSVNPAFAILRARLVSNSPLSITDNVKFVRLEVDGVTRDSTPVGPAFRAVSFGNASSGIAVGDSGNMIRTMNSGVNWAPVTSGTTADLKAICMTGANAGFAVGMGGVVRKTTNSIIWTAVTSNTTDDLYGTWFSGGSNGWAVGEGGRITKTINGTTFAAQASGTTQDLHGVHFSSANNGTAVGKNGTIRRTTNGGTTWSGHTSGTTEHLNAVYMTATATGFAVGDGGVILRFSSNAWTAQGSGTTANLKSVWFLDANNGTVSGEDGLILTTTNAGADWTVRASGTVEDLYGIGWSTNESVGVGVGALGTVAYTTDNSSFTRILIGTKSFDMLLAYKYFTPNVTHSLLLEAIDTLAGPLRGYQALKSVTLAPGKDTTVTPNSSLSKCGYGGVTPACQ